MHQKRFTFQERIKQDIMILTANEDFLADVKKLRDKYDYSSEVGNDEIELRLDSSAFNDHSDYNKDSTILVKKYAIPESHFFAFDSYVHSGNLDPDFSDSYRFFHLNPQTISANTTDCVTLKIYPDTTLKDIQENWPRIKYHRDKILGRQFKRKVRIENLDRDLEILG